MADSSSQPAALAVAAHPDDIEFYMAGTLLLLRRAGWRIHYLNLASGSCGSNQLDASRTRRQRRQEARRAALILEARHHDSFVDDLEITYDLKLLRRLAALVRRVRPRILLTHSPQDYMEDHTNTSRLAVTAAFARGMPNFKTLPPRRAVPGEITVYHAMPHGLRDGLRRLVVPGSFVNTTPVQDLKRKALLAHQSQKLWLDASQGMDSYVRSMEDLSRKVGRMSRRFEHAEGWRRHLHYGFCAESSDPLAEALGSHFRVNRAYERQLNQG